MKADQDLVEEVKNGQVSSFAELVTRHKKLILRLALRMTRDLPMAEDIVQESFLKAYRKIHLFEERASFKSWLYQITLNTARNKLRSRKYKHITMDKVNLSIRTTLDGDIFKSNLKKILGEEIELLPLKQRTALSLRIFDDLSFKEIAEIMACPYDTAKANYRHALMKLRHRFEEDKNLKKIKETNLYNFIDNNSYIAEVE